MLRMAMRAHPMKRSKPARSAVKKSLRCWAKPNGISGKRVRSRPSYLGARFNLGQVLLAGAVTAWFISRNLYTVSRNRFAVFMAPSL
jgi:hypothetical protein